MLRRSPGRARMGLAVPARLALAPAPHADADPAAQRRRDRNHRSTLFIARSRQGCAFTAGSSTERRSFFRHGTASPLRPQHARATDIPSVRPAPFPTSAI